jgi:hypothetical protein
VLEIGECSVTPLRTISQNLPMICLAMASKQIISAVFVPSDATNLKLYLMYKKYLLNDE